MTEIEKTKNQLANVETMLQDELSKGKSDTDKGYEDRVRMLTELIAELKQKIEESEK